MVASVGCGFTVSGEGDFGAGSVDASIDSTTVTTDAATDPPVPLPLFAASNQMLYKLDVDIEQTMLIGPIAETAASPIDVDGLALYDTQLIGVTPGGTELITINPATAAVTARTTLAPVGKWGGLTVAPAGQHESSAVVFAGNGDDGKLYRINPATGAVTMVGSFGAGLRFFSDLAWVKGAGLYATLTAGVCADVCLASINPTTGVATVFRSNLMGVGANLFGLSGYRDQLWALNSAGPVLTVDRTSGVLALEFDPQIAWTEAAQ